MINARVIVCFLFLSFCACKESKKETKEIKPKVILDTNQSVNNDQLSDFVGEYEFKYPDNPEESLLLILKTADIKNIPDFEGYAWKEKNEKGEVVEKTMTGLIYGNTDLFDIGREGYKPGFFVANVQAEPSGDTSLKVEIQLDSSDMLEKPILPNITSTKEALEKGNTKWEVTEMDILTSLLFEIKNPNELIMKSDLGLEDKIFKKIK